MLNDDYIKQKQKNNGRYSYLRNGSAFENYKDAHEAFQKELDAEKNIKGLLDSALVAIQKELKPINIRIKV